jgi:large subunit ribosomal protein L34e
MPKPSLRSRSKKRHRLRLPGGRNEIRYRRGRTNSSSCLRCGQELSGVPRLKPSRIRKLAGSTRRPERMYGGQMCPTCLRNLLKQATRNT